jgi:hypothetical protein
MRIGILAGAAAVAAAGVTLTAAAARADGSKFGGAGELAISSDAQLAVQGQQTTPPQGSSTSGSTIVIAPAADYFVINNLSVGGQLVFESISTSQSTGANTTTSSTTTGFGIGPRVGYNIGFTDTISLWPRVSFSYLSLSTSNNGPSQSKGTLGIFAPVVFVPVPHFFLGLGPEFSLDVISNESFGGQSGTGNKVMTYGVQFTLGGWILGD